jgi:hypothetical protein
MMSKDEQARARLVEIALDDEFMWRSLKDPTHMSLIRQVIRKSAGFKDTTAGSWSAAGLTDAMDRAGLVVPAPGTEARRRSIALLDFVHRDYPVWDRARCEALCNGRYGASEGMPVLPGDIIAWLQHPPPDPAEWRRGHVAVIVAVDDESITTVGWGEGPKPGRVMMRRLWRDQDKACVVCLGFGFTGEDRKMCRSCNGKPAPLSSTVLWRRPGGLYGIARPVAR